MSDKIEEEGCDGDDQDGGFDKKRRQQQHRSKEKKKKRWTLGKARNLLLHPVDKFRSKKRPPPPVPLDAVPGEGCYLRFLPRAAPHPSHRTGGSDQPSYYDLLRSLIEKNDFYSRECNVHGNGEL